MYKSAVEKDTITVVNKNTTKKDKNTHLCTRVLLRKTQVHSCEQEYYQERHKYTVVNKNSTKEDTSTLL